jgi:hypothetical protein
MQILNHLPLHRWHPFDHYALHLHDFRFILDTKKEFVTSVRPVSNGGGLLVVADELSLKKGERTGSAALAPRPRRTL